MSFQGKQLPAEMVEAIVRLKNHFDKERRLGKFTSTKDAAKRTANALGIGVATVKRIMAQYKKDGDEVVVRIKQRPGDPHPEYALLYSPSSGNLFELKTWVEGV
ncbi:MAG: hypothetical protein SRB2_03168 [Desulfobacteraceae bacterium Eth-SRB2]|nr:MAG: hypothetical protein SRB2_03168 [Desulfobacteraceae bacterium Eth-SRB2]